MFKGLALKTVISGSHENSLILLNEVKNESLWVMF